MIASGRCCLAALTLLGSLGHAAHVHATGLVTPTEQNRLVSQLDNRPMVFFLAKGPADSCGPGCSEWIAAEGKFVLGTAQRFRDFVATLAGKNPPIFFHSLGGHGYDALQIGVMMRERRMTAGIGRTVPDRCRVFSKDDVVCQRLIASGGEVKAQLLTREGQCHSACVFAFAGASVRHIAPGAKVGVHSVRIDMALKRRLMRQTPNLPDITVASLHLGAGRYLALMGVDPQLVAIGARVDARRMYLLSRDEIDTVGLVTRGFYETTWFASIDPSKRHHVGKAITQAVDGGSGGFRTSGLQIWCFDSRVWVIYLRDLPSGQRGAMSSIRIAAGGNELPLHYGQEMGGRELWLAPASSDFLRAATAASSVLVIETVAPGSARHGTDFLKLSTTGLTKPLESLQKECPHPKPPSRAGSERAQ